MQTTKCMCGKEISYTHETIVTGILCEDCRQEKNRRTEEEKRNFPEMIQALKIAIVNLKEQIRMLESRAAYKEEEIQELKTELQIWKNGCELYEKLIAKLIKKEGVCTNISARPAETFTIPLRKTPNF